MKTLPPFLNFAPLQNGATRLKSATARFEAAYAAAFAGDGPDLGAGTADSLDALLLRAEHALAPPEGLPRRPWYRQLISAPGWYTGYVRQDDAGSARGDRGEALDRGGESGGVLGRALEAGGRGAGPGRGAAGAGKGEGSLD